MNYKIYIRTIVYRVRNNSNFSRICLCLRVPALFIFVNQIEYRFIYDTPIKSLN